MDTNTWITIGAALVTGYLTWRLSRRRKPPVGNARPAVKMGNSGEIRGGVKPSFFVGGIEMGDDGAVSGGNIIATGDLE